MKTNQYCIAMASQTPNHLAIYLPIEYLEHFIPPPENDSPKNSDEIKKWDDGG